MSVAYLLLLFFFLFVVVIPKLVLPASNSRNVTTCTSVTNIIDIRSGISYTCLRK